MREAVSLFELRTFNLVASCAFWHGLLGLDGKLRPLTPIYTWADSRCASDAAQLRREFSEDDLLQRTGCMLRFPHWPAKLRWLRRTRHALFRRARFWVSPADWLLHDLFGDLATSESMASGTGLFDQVERNWDLTLCDALKLRQSQLPPVRRKLDDDGKALTAIGDGAASNIGSGATSEHIAAINLGTSAAVRLITHRPLRIPAGLFRYVVNERTFVLGGAISNAGNLHQWCERMLRLPQGASLDRGGAATDTLVALPSIVAERSPDWPEMPATISGLTLATAPAEILRAFITSAFYRLAEVFDLLEQCAGPIERVIVSGGMTRSSAVVGILADVLRRDLELAAETEASLRGAALHALVTTGDFAPAKERGRIIRVDEHSAELHRVRREKQRSFADALSLVVKKFDSTSRSDLRS